MPLSPMKSPRLDSIEENAPGPYGYEKIALPDETPHYRIYDADDNRIATCFQEGHAKLIVRLMNLGLAADR